MPAGNLGFGSGDNITGMVRSVLGGGYADATTVLYDAFTDTNGTHLAAHTPNTNLTGHVWDEPANNWTIQGNKLVPNAGVAGSLVDIDTGHVNLTLSVDIVTQDDNHIGVFVRALNTGNYYLVQIRFGNVEIYENINDSFDLKSTTAITVTSGVSYPLSLVVSGATLSVYFNGAFVVSQVMTQFLTATTIGFRQGDVGAAISYDNLIVTY